MVFPIVPMSLDLGADHGALYEGKAQISRGLAMLVRKSSMLRTRSATGFDRWLRGNGGHRASVHLGHRRESGFCVSCSK
jgi:hypothetical protein